jgi:hypothetical protein
MTAPVKAGMSTPLVITPGVNAPDKGTKSIPATAPRKAAEPQMKRDMRSTPIPTTRVAKAS